MTEKRRKPARKAARGAAPKPARKPGPGDSTAAVDAFMAGLEHPCKSEIEALRKIIRGADPTIAEGVKWNAPSFRTTECFATTHLRSKRGVGLILHLGAKARDTAAFAIDDPDGMLEWLAKDRAMIAFADAGAISSGKRALQKIVRQWIKHV